MGNNEAVYDSNGYLSVWSEGDRRAYYSLGNRRARRNAQKKKE